MDQKETSIEAKNWNHNNWSAISKSKGNLEMLPNFRDNLTNISTEGFSVMF